MRIIAETSALLQELSTSTHLAGKSPAYADTTRSKKLALLSELLGRSHQLSDTCLKNLVPETRELQQLATGSGRLATGSASGGNAL